MPIWSRGKRWLILWKIKTKETGEKRRSIYFTDEVTSLFLELTDTSFGHHNNISPANLSYELSADINNEVHR